MLSWTSAIQRHLRIWLAVLSQLSMESPVPAPPTSSAIAFGEDSNAWAVGAAVSSETFHAPPCSERRGWGMGVTPVTPRQHCHYVRGRPLPMERFNAPARITSKPRPALDPPRNNPGTPPPKDQPRDQQRDRASFQPAFCSTRNRGLPVTEARPHPVLGKSRRKRGGGPHTMHRISQK